MNRDVLTHSQPLQELAGKHLLVDTCVVSNIFSNPNEFKSFLGILDVVDCKPTINDFIFLEFIRIAKRATEKAALESFLKSDFRYLPCTPDIFDNAQKLYPLYNHCRQVRNKNQISVVDALNVAYMKKYAQSLYLLTLDHGDYPLELVVRIQSGTIEIDTDILTWAIYKFNTTGYQERLQFYSKQ